MPIVHPTRVQLKRAENAMQSMHRHYFREFGVRWFNGLSVAMMLPTRFCALMNAFVPRAEIDKAMTAWHVPPDELSDLQLPCENVTDKSQIKCLTRKSRPHPGNGIANEELFIVPFPRAGPADGAAGDGRLFTHWNLDAASVVAASMLQAGPGDKVLDLCSAPGGKSIALAQALWPHLHADNQASKQLISIQQTQTCLHCNEVDPARNKRLKKNLEAYLPGDLFKFDFVEVTRIDGADKRAASMLPLGEGGYDKVLLDAPCSSERHIMHADRQARDIGHVAEEMMNWKPTTTRTLAKTQVALLMTALQAVKLGGTVVYATCSVSSEENDTVIEKVLELTKRNRKRHADDPRYVWQVEVIKTKNSTMIARLDDISEETRYGRIALPDHSQDGRWGPLYFCVLSKQQYKKKDKSDKV